MEVKEANEPKEGLMVALWAIQEMETADLEDQRLNDRLSAVLSSFAERPTASIPAACGGRDEMVAAYRFFDNEKVTYEGVLSPHFDSTLKRIAAQPVALLVQDTTELDFTRPRHQVQGAGSLDGSSRRGAFLHPLIGFAPDGMPLGACWATMWTRDDPLAGETRSQKEKRRRSRAIEEKESQRWIDGLRQAHAVARQVPETQCVLVADSEADIYELFLEPRPDGGADWLVRACQDRAIVEGGGNETPRSLRESVEFQPVVFTHTISVRGRPKAKVSCETRGRRQPRESRTATVEVRAATVTLRAPQRRGGSLSPVTVNVVQVRESDPPPDDEPVEWLLLTSLPIATAEQIRQVVQYYAVRFMVEVLFRILKSGCRVEERRFEHIERMLPCVAVYLIVAWRTLMVCRLARHAPDLDCEAIFDPAEWKSVWMAVRRKKPPRRIPKLGEFLPMVAELGGYVNYPNRKDPPGPQTVWLGLQRMYDLSLAWNLFGPDAREAPD
jgi:hypothetical protein